MKNLEIENYNDNSESFINLKNEIRNTTNLTENNDEI